VVEIRPAWRQTGRTACRSCRSRHSRSVKLELEVGIFFEILRIIHTDS
jgi:hypothetical protein